MDKTFHQLELMMEHEYLVSASTDATKTLALAGLQNASSSDMYVTTDATGVLRTRAGGISSIVTKTSTYTATDGDETILANASSAAVTITLPAPVVGKKYTIKKIDASTNAVKIATTSGTIDGATAPISGSVAYQGWTLQSDGTNWFVIAKF